MIKIINIYIYKTHHWGMLLLDSNVEFMNHFVKTAEVNFPLYVTSPKD